MRRRWRNVLFVGCAVLCVLGAVGQALDGKWGGALVVAGFGAVLLVLPIGDLVARRTGTPVHVEGGTLVIPGSRAKRRVLRAGALAFALVGAGMAFSPGSVASAGESTTTPRVVGIACVLFFGVIGLASAIVARGEYRIVMTPRELSWSLGVAPTSVAWEAIESAHPFSIRGTWFLAIEAPDGAVQTPPRQRWLARLNTRLVGSSAQIALQLFPVEPEQLAKVVSACAAVPELRARIATTQGVRWVTGEERLDRLEPTAS